VTIWLPGHDLKAIREASVALAGGGDLVVLRPSLTPREREEAWELVTDRELHLHLSHLADALIQSDLQIGVALERCPETDSKFFLTLPLPGRQGYSFLPLMLPSL
jgi:hypothetical protein